MSGVIKLTIYQVNFDEKPFYIIFDNTDTGDEKPARDNIDNVATVTVSGNVSVDIPDSDSESSSGSSIQIFLLCFIVFIVCIIILIIVVVIYYVRKRGQPVAPSTIAHRPPPPPCPKCNSQMNYINEYKRWYCDNCRKYQ